MGIQNIRILMIIHTNTLCRPGEYNLSSPVQVIQINVSGRAELPENGTVSLVFNIPEVVNYIFIYTINDAYVCTYTS